MHIRSTQLLTATAVIALSLVSNDRADCIFLWPHDALHVQILMDTPRTLNLLPTEVHLAPQVQLQAMPMQRGLYHLAGCRTTVLAVTWSQPWTPRAPSIGEPDT